MACGSQDCSALGCFDVIVSVRVFVQLGSNCLATNLGPAVFVGLAAGFGSSTPIGAAICREPAGYFDMVVSAFAFVSFTS